MTVEDISTALTREHREIDDALGLFVIRLREGVVDAVLLDGTLRELRNHIYVEEAHLFPQLLDATSTAGQGSALVMPVTVMLREHGALWRSMDALGELMSADDASIDGLATVCLHLLTQLADHNQKEEPIIYPQAEALSPTENARLVEVLGGPIPAGWTCARADEG